MLSVEQLEQLAARWRAAGAPIVEHLRGGLTDARMDELTDPIGLRLPAEARTWWAWHDGTDSALALDGRASERDLGIGMQFRSSR